MAPSSLVKMCTRVAVRSVNMITDLGDMPNNLALPILRKVNNAAQLRQIEINSPHLICDTGEAWQRIITRDFPKWETRDILPVNTESWHLIEPESWHEIYALYEKDEKDQLRAAEQRLKNAFATLESEKEAKKSKIVEQRLLPRPPRDGRGAGGRAFGHLSFGGGSRTKPTNGQSFLKKARKEAREIANRRALSTPTGQLPVRAGQIRKAPEAMVNEHRIKQQPQIRIHAPRSRSNANAVDPDQKEREARLLRLRNMSSAQAVSSHDETDDSSLDNLFGDEAAPEPKPASATKPALKTTNVTSSSASSGRKILTSSSQSRKHASLLSNSPRPDLQKVAGRSPASSTAQTSPSPHLKAQQPRNGSTQPSNSLASARASSDVPKAELQKRNALFPPTSSVKSTMRGSASPPPIPQQDQSTTTATPATGSPMSRKRKPAVNVFMRPKKVPRT